MAKKIINQIKKKLTEWEKIFTNYPSDKRLISRVSKELKKLNTNKTNNPIKMWVENVKG
jgi:hypothetical protein